VSPAPAAAATSSRRNPGVRLDFEAEKPRSVGATLARRNRRNDRFRSFARFAHEAMEPGLGQWAATRCIVAT
jgi:hypothetical protein